MYDVSLILPGAPTITDLDPNELKLALEKSY